MNDDPRAGFCPYKGLQPYTEADRAYFFGRERDQEIIASNLYAAPLTVLYGASGVGKSSVLLAGVVPKLRKTPRLAVVVFRDWQNPEFQTELKNEVRREIERGLGKPCDVDAGLPFDDFLAACARSLRGPVFFLLDQFEEYFLYHPAAGENGFDAAFARAVNREEIGVNFMLSMREDGISKLDRFQGRIPNLLANLLRLDYLDREAATRAIRRPLDEYNRRLPAGQTPIVIEDKLVETLLRDLRTGRVTLDQAGQGQGGIGGPADARIETPFLQLVLTRLWQEEVAAGTGALRLATLDRLGGTENIARTHLDTAMEELSEPERDVAAHMFRFLVTPSGSKIAQDLPSLAAWSEVSEETAKAVLLRLTAGTRILRTVSAAGQADRYEIFHDVLAPAILDWRRRYVQAQELREAERQAAEQKKRAEEQARAASRLRWLAGALAVVTLLVLAVAIFAVRAQRVANSQERIATSRELAAAAEKHLGDELGTLLAIEAVQATHAFDGTVTNEARDVLDRAVGGAKVKLSLPGHENVIFYMAYSPDGRRIATGDGDHILKIWDANSGRLLKTLTMKGLTPHLGIAFSANGERVATTSESGTIVLDVSSGIERLSQPGWHDMRDNFVLSQDGERLAVYTAGRKVKISGLPGRPEPLVLPDTDAEDWTNRSLAFSPDGARLTVASAKTVTIYDAATGSVLRTFPTPAADAQNVVLSPNARRIATVRENGEVGIWDIEGGRDLPGFRAEEIKDLRFSFDGTRLVCASVKQTLIWDVDAGAKIREISGYFDIAVSPKGDRLALNASGQASFSVTDAVSGKTLFTSWGIKEMKMRGVAFSTNHKLVAATVGAGEIQVWSPGFGREMPAPAAGQLRVWDTASGREVLAIETGTAGGSLALSPDGKRIAMSMDNKGTATLWETGTGKLIETLAGHEERIYRVAFNRDGSRLATSDGYMTMIWDATSGASLYSLPTGSFGISFSPDSARLVTARGEVWDLASKRKIFAFSAYVLGCEIIRSPDGRRLAISSIDSSGTTVFDAASGKSLFGVRGGAEDIYAILGASGVAFSPDGDLLATVLERNTVKVWNAHDGTEWATLYGHGSVVRGIAFSADGSKLIAVTDDWTMHVHPLRIEDLMALARTRVKRELTADERKKYLHEP
ncbi:MAG TPA: WD40 repeat domain-containing protein [Thermoanaerobaculia bacterium]|jgi:WD40 repeat protein|nr:WD40 repeat domain-containing protein [Thermoanaerobaculia bacterium]